MKKSDNGKDFLEKKENMPLYPIGVVSELIGITDQTLRLYEKHGLIKPSRRNKNRYYSENDIKWLRCVRNIIHDKKISIEGIKLLLDYAPCWEISNCAEQDRRKCIAYVDKAKPCWELKNMRCGKTMRDCNECFIYLSSFKRLNVKK